MCILQQRWMLLSSECAIVQFLFQHLYTHDGVHTDSEILTRISHLRRSVNYYYIVIKNHRFLMIHMHICVHMRAHLLHASGTYMPTLIYATHHRHALGDPNRWQVCLPAVGSAVDGLAR